MISGILFKKELKSNYKVILIFMAVLTLYICSIISMFNPKSTEALDELIKSMPELMKAFGMESTGNTLIEFLTSYLYGFLILIFPMIFEIILANKLVVRYIDRGSMAYLLSTPIKREKLIMTQAVFMWISIAILIIYVTTIGIVFSEVMFPGDLDINKFIMLNTVVYILHIAISGICFLASCISNDTKLYFSIGAGIPIAFYLIQMLATMGEKLEYLKYFTIFTLFNTKDIIAGKSIVLPILSLLCISILLYGLGIIIFSKRDLPL